ncbi:hypothetical protein [Thaumasiovibrio subtropicus]|uniref:hypothetical protein n=1 Tax=Thaumasiovibrio subtropicus TaxID=1891207 RepID=UPI000B35E3CF|nr:hypothetical protein [Thaumasiovibrio subtropicus]
MPLSESQIQELTGLGLSEHECNDISIILDVIPETPNKQQLQQLKTSLEKAAKAALTLEHEDPMLMHDINAGCFISGDQLAQQAAAIGSTLDYFEATAMQTTDEKGGHHTRVVTPKSKNFRRFDALTKIWCAGGRENTITVTGPFILYLTICFEGQYSAKGAERVRNNYRRYYLGRTLEGDEANKAAEGGDHIELTVTLKDGTQTVTEVNKLTAKALSEQVKKLKNKRG